MAAGDYREAQAEAAAARARAKALRPWYRKKRYLVGVPLAVLTLLVFAGGVASRTDTTTGTAASEGSTTGGPVVTGGDATARIGDLVRVGSLDLTITSVDPSLDAAAYHRANRATVAVAFRATNTRGDEGREYEFLLNAFKLVDAKGVTHPRAACIDCPGDFATKGLVRGGTLEGIAYFEVPPGATLTELIYDPLFSNNRARISLQ
ncbi:MAG: DUF4352 domain-containing protein [Dehalococcoidia bacterium]